MPRNTSDTPRSRILGAQLRHVRESRYAGSLRAFADTIGVRAGDLSKWETGRALPSSETVGVILGALGVVGKERDDIIEAAKAASDPNWIAPGVDRMVSALIEYEKTARRIVSIAPLFVSGMLQTEDAARAIVSANPGTTEGQVKATVATRMGRKEALVRPNPPQFDAYLGMRAITRTLGGLNVHLNQLRYIQKMAALDNITVRVIQETDEFNPADMGPFMYYEFPVGDPIVFFEHHRSSMFAPKRDLPDLGLAITRVEEVAMSPDTTSELIADVIKRMETTQ